MTITLRPAQKTDQEMIRALVRAAQLNPLRVHWQNFLIAEQAAPNGQAGATVVGIGQLRPHGNGVVELGSLVVVESAQGQGVGTLLVHALMARVDGPLYLMCATPLVAYYTRFGFVQLTRPSEMPRMMRWVYRLSNLLQPIVRLIAREEHRVNIMVHPTPSLAANPTPHRDQHSVRQP